jgi:hypothetical protein
MITPENPPTQTEEAKWVYNELLRMADYINQLEEQVTSLQEQLANS